VQQSMKNFERRSELLNRTFEVSGITLNGQPFNWEQYRGKVVLIDYWATTCEPCVQEIPNIIRNFDRYREKGFEVVSINLDVDLDELRQWLSYQPLPWPTVVSADPKTLGMDSPMAVNNGISYIPYTVLVGRDGRVRVMDFGVVLFDGSRTAASRVAASVLRDGAASQRLTADGSVVGTPAYMPPEQHFGCPQDARTDQFSFCVALYHALTGELPFMGRDLGELCHAKQSGSYRPLSPPRQVPPAVWDAILRGLAVWEPGARLTIDARPGTLYRDVLSVLDPGTRWGYGDIVFVGSRE